MAPVHQHRQLDPFGSPQVEQGIERRPTVRPVIEHVVHQHHGLPGDIHRDHRPAEAVDGTAVEVVAVEPDVELAYRHLDRFELVDGGGDRLGERDPQRVDADQNDVLAAPVALHDLVGNPAKGPPDVTFFHDPGHGHLLSGLTGPGLKGPATVAETGDGRRQGQAEFRPPQRKGPAASAAGRGWFTPIGAVYADLEGPTTVSRALHVGELGEDPVDEAAAALGRVGLGQLDRLVDDHRQWAWTARGATRIAPSRSTALSTTGIRATLQPIGRGVDCPSSSSCCSSTPRHDAGRLCGQSGSPPARRDSRR